MFHDYHFLINMHKRQFSLYKAITGATNPNTTRYEPGGHSSTPISLYGVFETVTEKELEGFGDGEHIFSDLKLLISGTQLGSNTISIKDKIVYNGTVYFVVKIRDYTHYGNFLIVYLKKEEGNV